MTKTEINLDQPWEVRAYTGSDCCIGPENFKGMAVVCFSIYDGREHRRAVADLMASAPELLKALEVARDEMCTTTFNLKGRHCKGLNYAIELARKAIVKAKGSSNAN